MELDQHPDFAIERRIATGGMAWIYAARHRSTGAKVALKVMAPDHATDNNARRLRQEGDSMMAMSHPNVLKVFDIAETGDGHPMLVMERMARSVEQLLNERGPLGPRRAVDITLQVLGALAHAHRRGVVHRDIKPGNILLGHDGSVRVADFGIAQVQDTTRHTQVGTAMGSLGFMAPEQRVDASQVDHRADIYSAGCLLYAMATCQSPADLFVASIQGARLQSLPPTLRAVVYAATRYGVQDRTQTVDAFVRQLEMRRDDMPETLLQAAAQHHQANRSNLTAAEFLRPTPPMQVPRIANAPLSCPTAPMHPNEEQRLAAVKELTDSLDGQAPNLERYARLACRALDVPFALISVIAETEQKFLGAWGLPVGESSPRDIAFCAHTILEPGVTVVPDAAKDPRFADNVFVTQPPHLRFYAGYPLRSKDGLPLGTLGLLDIRPRELSDSDLAVLANIGGLIERDLQRDVGSLDPETGIINRAGFEIAVRANRDSTAQLLHVEFPHDSPRANLQRAAQQLSRVFRDAIAVARVGPREFAVWGGSEDTLWDCLDTMGGLEGATATLATVDTESDEPVTIERVERLEDRRRNEQVV